MNADDRPSRWWEETHGVPRRFGVGALLAVTVVYALAFSLASGMSKRWGDPLVLPITVSILFVWLTLVAIAQALLFGGRRPRLASLVTGTGLYVFCAEPVIAWQLYQFLYYEIGRIWTVRAVVFSIVASPLIGVLLGYLTGGVVAGVFVILAGFKRRRYE